MSSAKQYLSPREVEVAELATQGHRTTEIAELLFISSDTAKTHLKSIFRKLEVHNRAELAARWFRDVPASGARTRRQAVPALVPRFILAGAVIATLFMLASSNASPELEVSAIKAIDVARSANAGAYPISREKDDCTLVWTERDFLASCPR